MAPSLRSSRSHLDDEYDEDAAGRAVPVAAIHALLNEGGE